MLRFAHSTIGLMAAVLTSVLAVTGAILSIQPAIERASVSVPAAGEIDVATVAAIAAGQRGEIEGILRSPSGVIIVNRFVDGRAVKERLDVMTGKAQPMPAPSALIQGVTNLHRSLLLGDNGRAAAGIGALCMVVLAASGLTMLANRLGGWRAVLRPMRGSPVQRWHGEIARAAVAGLLVSSLSATYMSLATFELITDGMSIETTSQSVVESGERLAPGRMKALRGLDINDLRELTFPQANNPGDVYRLTTAQGIGQIDAATGVMLTFSPHAISRQVYETLYMLHTGQGLWALALILGLTALAVPVLSITGTLIWWRRRRAASGITANAAAHMADTIILVGSEGRTTWGFAASLHSALTRQGHKVHVAGMNSIPAAYGRAQRLLVLTSTYGDGVAPASANRFLKLIERGRRPIPFAVLGFGDRSFPRFCRFAEDVEAALAARGWPVLLPIGRIDRQSAQAFAQWGVSVGKAIGTELTLDHVVARPNTVKLSLIERTDYGQEVQAPTAILRFAVHKPKAKGGLIARVLGRGGGIGRFVAGDLVGIIPPGSTVPRYYSLASSAEDGVLEICVRKQPGGLCSGHLHELTRGGVVDAFIKSNPDFRPRRGHAPLVLIGAGAGIGPLVGIIRRNCGHRPVHLYWGGRHPGSDFLYEGELTYYLADQRLTRVRTAFSRVARGLYVQDRIALEANVMRELIKSGAQVMVCGGRDMAGSVADVIDGIIQPIGLDLSALRAEGRYVEDVY